MATAWDYIYFDPTDEAMIQTEGVLRFSDANNALEYWNGSAIVQLTSGTGDNTLDNAYDQGGAGAGSKVDVDSGVIEFEVDAQSNNGGLFIDCDDTNNLSVLLIETVGTATTHIALDIDGQATGRDIEGTGAAWHVNGDGSANFNGALTMASTLDVQGGNITLQNDEYIGNSTDTEIIFGSDTEDFSIDFQNNALALSSSSGVVTVGWGDLDAFTGLNTIAMDAAASSISLASDGNGDDLTIQVTGATDSSVVIASSGTEADAMQITASAGGIDISATGAATQDIDIVNTGGSVNIEGTEGVADAIVLNASTAAGGIDITSNADIDITTTGASGEDITITNSGGSVTITATENDAAAITIATTGGGGTSESINIQNDQGTGTDAIDIDATAGGIDVDAADDISLNIATTGAGEDLTLSVTGAQNSSIILDSDGTGSDAISLQADGTGGGIDIDTDDGAISITADGTANGDITIDANDKIIIVSTDTDGTDSIYIHANGGTSEDIRIHSDQGTAADSIELLSDVGGIDITAETLATGDINIDANDALTLLSSSLVDNGLTIEADGGTGEGIYIHSDQGTSADSIELLSDVGGIDITAEDTAAGDILVDANDDLFLLSTSLADNGLTIEVDGGANEGIYIHSDQGTSVDSIELASDVGGITIEAEGAQCAGYLLINTVTSFGAPVAFAGADGTPDISGNTYFETGGADTYTDFDAGGGTIPTGTIIIVESEHAATFDVTASGLTGGTADLVTADGDITMWIYNGADWILLSFTDQSDDLS
jgi:hypothetical protein